MLITRVLHVMSCYCYHKGTYFQANHNDLQELFDKMVLLLLPQRYVFSSKSQLRKTDSFDISCCYCYHKGTYFQANHNSRFYLNSLILLLLLPQRYVFSSKSQLQDEFGNTINRCYCYHKGTYFQANHNSSKCL